MSANDDVRTLADFFIPLLVVLGILGLYYGHGVGGLSMIALAAVVGLGEIIFRLRDISAQLRERDDG